MLLAFLLAALNMPVRQVFAAPEEAANFVAITPTCLDRSTLPNSEYHWLYIPQSASELNTFEYYGFLAGQLIKTGVVDASDCPLNGVWPTGYANACGLDKTKDIVFELQNIYDEEVLDAGRTYGVPPVMMKQLIRYESQFWPSRYGMYHFGLGHLTLLGASTAIQWNPDLYFMMCELTYNGPCPGTYEQTYPYWDNILAGQLLNVMDASCPTCPYYMNTEKAEQSIAYIAQILMAYCRQASQIVYNVTQQHSSYSVDYATIWQLTLFNYNAGPTCVFDALNRTYTGGGAAMTWDAISRNVTGTACMNGMNYVNNITAEYYNFTPNP